MLGASPEFFTASHLKSNAVAYQSAEGKILRQILANLARGSSHILDSSGEIAGDGLYSCLSVFREEDYFGSPYGITLTLSARSPISFEDVSTYTQALCIAFNCLSEDYHAWVTDEVRHVFVDLDDKTSSNSWTSSSRPNVINISGNTDTQCLAEMLIHEASHLHYNANISRRLICTENAPEVYSSFTRSFRPLERVVFAYHAATNIMASFAEGKCGLAGDEQVFSDICKLREVIEANWRFLSVYGQQLVCALPYSPDWFDGMPERRA